MLAIRAVRREIIANITACCVLSFKTHFLKIRLCCRSLASIPPDETITFTSDSYRIYSSLTYKVPFFTSPARL